MKIFFLIFSLSFLLLSCGGGSNVKKDSAESGREKIEAGEAPVWFSPNELDENDISIEKKEKKIVQEEPEQYRQSVVKENRPEKENKIVDGFRVQLESAKSSKKIKEDFKVARSVFNPLGYEVYLIYESPLYKLRLGDALTRKNAEKIQKLAKSKGYRSSWIVPDSVNSVLDKGDE
jgi:Fe-S cluster assembly scaffold protein SufB